MKRLLTFCAAAAMLASSAFAQSDFKSQLPIKSRKGATVMGVVEADGKPLQGVAVSDGYEITLTDKKGCYYLNSEKKNGNVFITIPSGYETSLRETGQPDYWASLTEPATEIERHDFALKAVDNTKHVMLALTDIHLANMYNDVEQFKTIAMPRVREEVEKYRSQGIPVYAMCMGDSSFDIYWYDFLYDIDSFRSTLGDVKFPVPIFHAMGNHDNDGATPCDANTDFNATEKYRKAFGPTYYSFNIGGIHYIMLDNIVYKNEPGGKKAKNIAGARNYDHYVSQEQLDWLAKDLALVADKNTPIVIGMHCPVYRYKNRMDGKIETLYRTKDANPNDELAKKFSEVLKDFAEVHFFTGHTHRNATCYGKDDPSWPNIANTIDHNIGAVCGSWWRSSALGGASLGPDSAPSGFEVIPVDGTRMEWYWTSLDDGSSKQFRTFDINSVRDYYRNSGEMQAFLSHYPKRTDFGKAEDNLVYIHVWAWEPTWKITVKENGKEIPAVRKPLENPQYTLDYWIPKAVWERSFLKKYGKDLCPHMFLVKASAPDSTLEITVTDTFGHEYTETMIRPKEFSKAMH